MRSTRSTSKVCGVSDSMVVDVYGDLTLDQVGGTLRPGGPGYYISRALSCLTGGKVRVRIYSHGPREYMHLLANHVKRLNAEVIHIEAPSLTIFKHEYLDGNARVLSLISRSKGFSEVGLLEGYAGSAAIVSPVAFEVSYGMVRKLRYSYNVVGVDLQGFVRVCRPGTEVHMEPGLSKFLDFGSGTSILLIKASHDEVSLHDLDLLVHEVEEGVLLITMGCYGALVFEGDTVYHVNPLFVSEKEPIGAGDMFLASAVLSLLEEESDILTATAHACTAVPMLLEGLCPTLSHVIREARGTRVQKLCYAEALSMIKHAQRSL